MARPRWGRDGMPGPPPGVRSGTFMSNADLGALGWTQAQIDAFSPRASPVGGADVAGVYYPGGRWLPQGTEKVQLRRIIEFDEPLGKSKYRLAKITVQVGRTPEEIEASWRRFIQRWRRISDRSARFAS